jgi:purine nucleosidase
MLPNPKDILKGISEMAGLRRIIIDTDPGQDDAAAIMLALGSPDEIDLLGKNARIVCDFSGRTDVKVFAGCEKPIKRPLVTAEHVHGATGLDGPELFEPETSLQPEHAVDFIIDTLRREPSGTVTLCPLGALTNIATALTRAPDIAARIQEIVLMGGAYFEVGNITPAAEFNIYVDPEAAEIVFKSGVPIVMIPLDLTHKVLTLKARVNRIRALGTKAAVALADMLDFFERFDVVKYGSDGGPLHDPNVIGYLVKPELYAGRMCNVEIETGSELTLGMTVVDWWQVTERKHNALVLKDVDSDGFFELLTERVARL